MITQVNGFTVSIEAFVLKLLEIEAVKERENGQTKKKGGRRMYVKTKPRMKGEEARNVSFPSFVHINTRQRERVYLSFTLESNPTVTHSQGFFAALKLFAISKKF